MPNSILCQKGKKQSTEVQSLKRLFKVTIELNFFLICFQRIQWYEFWQGFQDGGGWRNNMETWLPCHKRKRDFFNLTKRSVYSEKGHAMHDMVICAEKKESAITIISKTQWIANIGWWFRIQLCKVELLLKPAPIHRFSIYQ